MVVVVGWIKGRNVKIKTLNVSGENIGDYCFDVGAGNTTIIRYYFTLNRLQKINKSDNNTKVKKNGI